MAGTTTEEGRATGIHCGQTARGGDRQTLERTTNYVLDDDDLLCDDPQLEIPKLAIPRVLVPRVLALVDGTHGHLGVARTLTLAKGKHRWPTVTQSVTKYVLSCGCIWRKRARSQRVATIPARLLRPWKVLEMNLQDMKQVYSSGNRCLVVGSMRY